MYNFRESFVIPTPEYVEYGIWNIYIYIYIHANKWN